MSTDKLAETIRSGVPGVGQDEESIEPAFAANRVREAFVVIDRDDLPEVVVASPEFGLREGTLRATVEYGSKGYVAEAFIGAPGSGTVDPEWHEAAAKAHLAAAEHLRANPPIDGKAVRDAARAMWPEATTSEQEHNARLEVARRLVADGWTKP